ncbi:MAG: hypothetical protein H7Y43_12785 [Akkermansiaceae bacterium]|nr:hypothetical protein [Verrucomicrobiales bacterium]
MATPNFTRPDQSHARYGFDPKHFGMVGGLILAISLVVGVVLVWFFCRIEPPSGYCAVLVRKDGRDLPANEIIAPTPEQKGLQLEPLSEGRYFYNPVNWSWSMHELTHIKEGEVGILVRQFGSPPPAGKFIVHNKEADGTMLRGIIDEPLRPGTYRINPFAYRVEKRPAIKIEPGEVGVVTLLYGNTPALPNTFLVKETEQGVQETPLRPGTYYLNPYIQRVDIVGVQSHKTEFEISFLSRDGFRFPVKGAVEWAVEEERAPEVLVMIGDAEDIVNKVILRSALSMSRVQGSKYSSADVISGTVRKAFQDEFSRHIATESARKGILVKAALISEIEPPQKIAEPIRDREIAVQTRTKYEREMERAETDAKVAEQKKLQDQKVRIVRADTVKKNAVQRAVKDQQVVIIDADRDLEVARKDLETADKTAQAIVSTGQGDADVIGYTRKAEASALRAVVGPFGNGSAYARFLYYNKIAPNVDSIMANSDGALAQPFLELSKPAVKGGAQ